jgi:hypothetical protein
VKLPSDLFDAPMPKKNLLGGSTLGDGIITNCGMEGSKG